MPSAEERLKDVLDETRLAMLGTQLLMGLQYRAAFTPGFARLPSAWQWLDGAALMLILASSALLLSTPAFHQLAEGGHATRRMLDHASGYLKWALAPLSVALSIDVSLAFIANAGALGAGLAGGGFWLAAAALWFAFPFYMARRKRRRVDMEDALQSLETRIVQALTEIRVILPGAQALFGFQVTAVLTEQFGHLPEASRYVHLASIAVVAVAVVMLIAPAAYHRITAQGNAEEGVLTYAIWMMLPAEGLIATGLIGDAYVTIRLIAGSQSIALAIAAAALTGFTVLLYVIPLMARGVRTRAAAREGRAQASVL